MKKLFVIMLFLFAHYNMHSQTPSKALKYLEDVSKACDSDSTMILTQGGINLFFARKVASYLSNTSDLSLYNNYFIANVSDGSLVLGQNFRLNGSSEVNKRVRDILSLSGKVQAKDNFGAILSKGDYSNNITTSLKYTHICGGTIAFDENNQMQGFIDYSNRQKKAMILNRILNLEKIKKQIEADSTNFFNLLNSIDSSKLSHLDEKMKNAIGNKGELKREFQKKKEAEVKKLFTEMEVNSFEEAILSHNSSSVKWFSITASLPITNTIYKVADSFTTPFDDKKFFPWEVSGAFTKVWDSYKKGKRFLMISFSAYLNNSIKNEDINKISLNTYKQLGGIDTLAFVELSRDEAYVGEYKIFFTSKLSTQFVYFTPYWDWIGLSLKADNFFGTYNPLNLQAGIPMILKSKDPDSKINIEIQFRAFDVSNTVKPDKTFQDKLTIGVNVGLPFNSIIY